MKTTTAVFGALAPLLITGCLDVQSYNGTNSDRAVNALAVHAGHLQGDIGDVHGINDDATLTEGATDGVGLSYVKVQTEKTNGTGMIILNLDGVLLDQLKVGDTTFGSYRNNTPIYALGCSGPNSVDIAYDQPADHGTLHVDAAGNDGSRTVTVTGVWTKDAVDDDLPTPAVATGSFVFTP